MNVEHVMTGPAHVLAPSATARQAAILMRDQRIGCVVVASQDKPDGMVTDRDLALRVLIEDLDPGKVELSEIMSPCPVFVFGGRDLRYAMQVMREQAVRRLPVVDGAHKIVGVISLDDVIRRISEELNTVSETIEREIAP